MIHRVARCIPEWNNANINIVGCYVTFSIVYAFSIHFVATTAGWARPQEGERGHGPQIFCEASSFKLQ